MIKKQENPYLPTNQIYESGRNLEKVNSTTVFPDYNSVQILKKK